MRLYLNEFNEINIYRSTNVGVYLSYKNKITLKSHYRLEKFKVVPLN